MEDDSKDAKGEVSSLKSAVSLLQRELDHNGKVLDHHGQQFAAHEARIKELEKANHGLATKVGIYKSKADKLAPPRLPLDEPSKPRGRSKH